MDTIRFMINNPVRVAVGVILVLLFGVLSIFLIPIQLTPNVDQPIITVTTAWTGRSPEEIERSVLEEQEDKVKSVTNLRKMTALASQGRAQITLEFYIGTNMTRVLQEVSDKLREVPEYPEGVDQPVITASEAAEEKAITWMMLKSDEPGFDVATLFHEADRQIKPYLERVEGLSQVNIYGGRDREVHIEVNPNRVAERGITFNELRAALRLENVNVSAGDLAEGRLDWRVRTVGQYEDLDSIRNTIVAYRSGGPVRIKDIAEVELTLEKRRSFVRGNSQPALAINGIRETGSNVMSVMEEVRRRVAEINRDILPKMGPRLHLEMVYDETVYIHDAIGLVTDNLWQGGALTVLVLLAYLRSVRSPSLVMAAVGVIVLGAIGGFTLPEGGWRTASLICIGAGMLVILLDSPPTMIISLAIPLSVIGTFVVMAGFGRNLNVVSLAGLAFAVGMVVDNAVVVLENTDRHLSLGKTPIKAAYDGAREVWLAVLASTATTVVVFIPVLTLEEEAGQLFKDISLAVCAAVTLSLIVSVTVIPSAASRWLHKKTEQTSVARKGFEDLYGLATLLDGMRVFVADFVHWASGSWAVRLGIVGLFTVGSLVAAVLLMPPTTYLPGGNQNLVFGLMLIPPGYNIHQNETIADRVEMGIRPYWESRTWENAVKLPPVANMFTGEMQTVPPVDQFFFVSWSGTIFMGAASLDKEIVQPIETLLTNSMMTVPGAFGFAQQASIFGRGLGGTNSLDVDLIGEDLGQVRASAEALYMALMQKYGQTAIRPDPLNFNLTGPELQVKIDRVKAADLGVDVAALGLGVQALVDGAIVGDYRYEGKSIDLLMTRDPSFELTPQTLAMVPVAVNPQRGGGTVPLSSIASLAPTQAPQEIKRIEQRRAITLTVAPPREVPLEQATAEIQAMIGPMRDAGAISPGVDVEMAGTADKLIQVRESFLGEWHGFSLASLRSLVFSRMFLALLVNYLVMAWLFNSF
ncbi:MAG: efflux RND transporter permease subunit, partial [Phycisphaeraceae bacterium]|nr:efflux RND transporter permease subunit [Phycisphaeraceae bacterium]